MSLVTTTARNHKNSAELRVAAVEVYIALIKSGPGLITNVYFLQEAVSLGFILLAEPEKALDFDS